MFSAGRLLGALSSFCFRVKRVSTVIAMAAFCNLPALCSFLVHILDFGAYIRTRDAETLRN